MSLYLLFQSRQNYLGRKSHLRLHYQHKMGML
nr:MAG TPA: hypothetical protein [Caudoviricetes sp.]